MVQITTDRPKHSSYEIDNLKADIQNKLKGKGYIVTSITLDVGYDDNYTLHQIRLSEDKEENKNYKKAYKRQFIIIFVILIMWFLTICYLVYILKSWVSFSLINVFSSM